MDCSQKEVFSFSRNRSDADFVIGMPNRSSVMYFQREFTQKEDVKTKNFYNKHEKFLAHFVGK